MIEFQYNDGGRSETGRRGSAGDCVARAIAIAAQLNYDDVYRALAEGNANQRRSPGEKKRRSRSARNGVNVNRKWFKELMHNLGFEWVATMTIGSGCRVHLRADELPKGRLVVSLSKHYAAVIDGVLNDTHDCSRNGTRCVYGYWRALTDDELGDRDRATLPKATPFVRDGRNEVAPHRPNPPAFAKKPKHVAGEFPMLVKMSAASIDELRECEFGSYEDHILSDGTRLGRFADGRLHIVEIIERSPGQTTAKLNSQDELDEFFSATRGL